MATILWIIAVVLVIAGIVQLFQGQVLLGIVLIVVGFLVGPGGVSIFATTTSLGLVGLWPTSRKPHITSVAPAPPDL
jgi:Family of unknown function (DUF5699)